MLPRPQLASPTPPDPAAPVLGTRKFARKGGPSRGSEDRHCGRRSGAAPWGRPGGALPPPPASGPPAGYYLSLSWSRCPRQRVNHEMDGRHGASFSSSSRGQPPPRSAPLPRTPSPRQNPQPQPPPPRSPNERSKCAGAAAATPPPPPPCRACVRGAAVRRRADQHATPLPQRPGAGVRGRRPGPGARRRCRRHRRRTSGERGPTEEGRGTGCGLWGRCGPGGGRVRTRGGGEGNEPARRVTGEEEAAAAATSTARRHLHFCPGFSVSQAPLPSGGGGEREEGGRREGRPAGVGQSREGAGLRKRAASPADWAAQPAL